MVEGVIRCWSLEWDFLAPWDVDGNQGLAMMHAVEPST